MWRDLVLVVLDWAVFIPRSFTGLPGWEMDCTGLVYNKKGWGKKRERNGRTSGDYQPSLKANIILLFREREKETALRRHSCGHSLREIHSGFLLSPHNEVSLI